MSRSNFWRAAVESLTDVAYADNRADAIDQLSIIVGPVDPEIRVSMHIYVILGCMGSLRSVLPQSGFPLTCPDKIP